MWGFKVKIRKADKLFSLYIRERDGWKCVRCGKQHDKSSKNFGVSHYYGRRHEATRFDPENVDSMCNLPCHSEWEHEKKEGREYYNFKLKQLGQDRFDRLLLRKHISGTKDDAMTMLKIKAMMKELENE